MDNVSDSLWDFMSVVELPLQDEECWDDYVDEFGRMNGTPSNYDYDPPRPAPRRANRSRSPRLRPISDSDSSTFSVPPRPEFTIVRSSAFGTGVLITNHSVCEAACNIITRRVRTISATGSVFYIGITENPANRWQEHYLRYDYLEILAQAHTSATTADLEKRLLSEFRGRFNCENVGPGGEGASAGSPHFCYIVVRRNGLLRRRGRGH